MAFLELWNQTTMVPGQGISAFHIHDRCEMLYICEGKVETKIGNTVYTLKAGQMAVISRLEMHNLIPLELPYKRIGLHIKTDGLNRKGISPFLSSVLENHPHGWCHVFDLQESPTARILIEELWQEYVADRGAKQEMMGVLFHQLLLQLYRLYPTRFGQTAGDKLMEEVKKHMEENFAHPSSVNEMAAGYYLTPSHFIVRFKKHTGYTPQKYRNLCRMAHARYLLLQEDMPLSQVAEQCGFSDLNGFVRSFRQTMNITPGRFRELAVKGEISVDINR